jgi:hypothetical protein
VNAGIADERFAIKRTAEPHLISVVGPPVYTTLVRQMLNALRDTARAPAPQPEPVAAPKREEPRPAPAPEQKPEPPKRVKQASPLDGESSAPQSPVQRATPVAPAASASTTASRPTAWQNMGIELKLTSAEEKKRLTRMLQREGENQRGNENAGVMVFRGGRR